MPGSYVWSDSPIWKRELDEQGQITQIQDYLYLWSEQMRYLMRNLDESNFNASGVRRLMEPIYLDIEKESENLSNKLRITAEGLTAEISSLSGQLSMMATAEELRLAIEGVEGQITQIDANIKGITLSVTNGDIGSTFSMTYNGVTITSPTITMDGLVRFTDLDGTDPDPTRVTTISGDLITTGTIDASVVTVDNLSADNIVTGKLSADFLEGGEIWGIDHYSVGDDHTPGNGFKMYNSEVEETIGGIRYQYESGQGVVADKLYLYTEQFTYGGDTYYPSIKLDSAGRISIEASDDHKGFVYVYSAGVLDYDSQGDDGKTGITLRTETYYDQNHNDVSAWIAIQSGDTVYHFRPDGIYMNGTQVI